MSKLKKRIKWIGFLSIGIAIIATPIVVLVVGDNSKTEITKTKEIDHKKSFVIKNGYDYLKEITAKNFNQWNRQKNDDGTTTKSNIEKYREYLKLELGKSDFSIQTHDFNYSSRNGKMQQGQNLELTIQGTNPNPSIIGIGAHYDIGIDLSSYASKPNGAIDNVSGVSAILHLSQYFKKNKPKNTIKLMLWDAEEEGLHGSYWYVNNIVKNNVKNWLGYINLDCVAGGDVIFGGHGFKGYRWSSPTPTPIPSNVLGDNNQKRILEFLLNKNPSSFQLRNIERFRENKKLNSKFDYQKGEELWASDHFPFVKEGIEIFSLSSGSIDTTKTFYFPIKTTTKGFFTFTNNPAFWKPFIKKTDDWLWRTKQPWRPLTKKELEIGIVGGPKNEPNVNVGGYPRYYEKEFGQMIHSEYDQFKTIEKHFPNRLKLQMEKVFNIVKEIKEYDPTKK